MQRGRKSQSASCANERPRYRSDSRRISDRTLQSKPWPLKRDHCPGALHEGDAVKVFSRSADLWASGKITELLSDSCVRVEYGVGECWHGKVVHVHSDHLIIPSDIPTRTIGDWDQCTMRSLEEHGPGLPLSAAESKVRQENMLASQGEDPCPEELRRAGRISALFQKRGPDVKADPDMHLKGVSVFYLTTTLQAEVLAAGFSHDTPIHELEPKVIREKGRTVICPRDGRLGAAYVDAIQGDDNVGRATHMLSYSWSYSMLDDVVASLRQYCEDYGLDPRRTYVWICCLCINQHRVIEMQQRNQSVPFEEFRDIFAKRVAKIKHLLALMAPWEEPKYLKRAWCVFEMFTAISSEADGQRVTILMPPSQKDRLCNTILASPSSHYPENDIYRAISNVDVENAEATVPKDKKHILDLLRAPEGPTIKKLNLEVQKFLKDWFGQTVARESRRLVDESSISLQQKANICTNVAIFLFDNGQYPAAKDIVEAAMTIVKTDGHQETIFAAQILTMVANLQMKQGEIQASLAAFEQASHIYMQCDAFHSEEGAVLCNGYGAALRKAQDLEGALNIFTQGRQIRVEMQTMHSAYGSTLLGNIGYVKQLQEEFVTAENVYFQALEIREQTESLTTAGGALLLESLALLYQQQGRPQEAGERYEQAKSVRTQLQILNTPAGALLLSRIGSLKVDRGDLIGGFEAYRAALSIRQSTDTLETRDGKDLQKALGAIESQVLLGRRENTLQEDK